MRTPHDVWLKHKPELEKAKNMKKSVAYSVNNRDDKWTIKCPDCKRGYVCDGFFNTEDMYSCVECGADFVAKRLEFQNGEVIE